MKVKYGKRDNSFNPIEHDSRIYPVEYSSYKSRLKNQKNDGVSYVPVVAHKKDSFQQDILNNPGLRETEGSVISLQDGNAF